MSSNNNVNFYKSSLYSRVRALTGGDDKQVETWWNTPNRFLGLKTPQEMMNADEWKIVKNFLSENVRGQFEDDIDYSVNTGKENKEEYMDTLGYVIATGGSETTLETQTASYKVHTFTSNGVFTVYRGGVVEYLIIGGGGGGGSGTGSVAGGGGGAGQFITGSITIPATNYDIIVGSGGSAGIDTGNKRVNTSGGNTEALGIIALGGGAGGTPISSQNTGIPLVGASGGGASSDSPTGANGILGAGYRGGDAVSGVGGGGGGSGGAGVSAVSTRSGDGGIGQMSDITGTQLWYAAGGAGGATGGSNAIGGAGGIGGGGSSRNANNHGSSQNGSSNTGSGGAGATGSYAGGYGGSGLVIIRYKIGWE